MAGMPAPQPDPKQQLDAAHAIAPPAANQTTAVADAINSVSPQGVALNAFLNKFNSTVKDATAPVQKFADGTANVQPVLPAAVANDPAWAARVQLNQTLNPPAPVVGPGPGPNLGLFSRALPSNGAPTPTFAPPPPLPLSLPHAKAMFDNAIGAATAAPIPTTPAPAQGQPVTQGGRSVTPPAATMGTYDNGNVQMTPGPISYVGPAESAGPNSRTVYAPGTLGHTVGAVDALANPDQHTGSTFAQALHGLTFNQIRTLMPILAPHLTPQNLAAQRLIQNEQHSKAATEALAQDQAQGLQPGTTLTPLGREYREKLGGMRAPIPTYTQPQYDENGNPVQ